MLLFTHFDQWLYFVLTLASGAFLGAYLKKKGENLATHEDIGKLVAEVKATTQATKAIEAAISDQFWNKRRLWEMKRDILLEVHLALGKMDDALISIAVVLDAEKKGETDASVLHQARVEAANKWNDATREYSSKRVTALLVCARETNTALMNANTKLLEAYKMLKAGEVESYEKLDASFGQAIAGVFAVIRKELGGTEPLNAVESFTKQ